MDAYDLVRTEVNLSLSKRLGFTEIISAVKAHLGAPESKVMMATEPTSLRRIREGIIGLISTDYKIGGQMLAEISDNETAVFIAVSPIISGYGIQRSRQIFRAAALFNQSEKKDIQVGFVSFAGTSAELCSRIQLLQLAKLISEDDSYAKRSISETNSLLLKAVVNENNI